MTWMADIARKMGIRHSDTMAVVRWGRRAKRGTNRRQRRLGKQEIRDQVQDVEGGENRGT